MSRSNRSGNDRNYYQATLWEEAETDEEQAGQDSEKEEDSLHDEDLGDQPSFLNDNLVDEGNQRLLEAAKEVVRLYPPSTKGPYKVSFYPYKSLKSTIRQQKSGVAIRISHLLVDAPKEVLAGVLHVLLSRFYDKKVPQGLRQPYEDFCRRKEIEERARNVRRKYGTKIIVGTKGEYRDLDQSFDRVNQTYFGGKIEKPTLTWSPGVSRRRMGYYDTEHHTIVISSGLDSKRVPIYVLDYIMYHELLHIVSPVQHRGSRRSIHTKEFNRLEKRYRDFDRANRWIKKYWR